MISKNVEYFLYKKFDFVISKKTFRSSFAEKKNDRSLKLFIGHCRRQADLSPLARCMLGMSAMESILESILYVDHINIILHTFYFCLFVRSCVFAWRDSVKQLKRNEDFSSICGVFPSTYGVSL